MRQPEIWLLVADYQSATVYRATGGGAERAPALEEVEGGQFRNERERHFPGGGSSRSFAHGRNHGRQYQARHGEAEFERQEREDKEGFLLEVLAWLVAPSNMPRFEYLSIAAPPPVLNDIRAVLPKKLRARVNGEIHADLATAPVTEIERHVAQHLWPVRSAD